MLVEKNIKKIYLWDKLIWPQRSSDASRTIFYYDFEQNLKDSSWNWNNITSYTWIAFDQVWWQYVSYLTNWSWYLQVTSTIWSSIWDWDFAVSFWIYPKQPSSDRYPMLFWLFNNASPYTWPTIFFDPLNKTWHWDRLTFRMRWWGSGYEHVGNTLASSLYDWRHHIVMTRNNWTVSCYIDNHLEVSRDNDLEAFPTDSNSSWYVLFSNNGTSQQFWVTWVKWDKVILENVWWSAFDVDVYFNQTKLIYWV